MEEEDEGSSADAATTMSDGSSAVVESVESTAIASIASITSIATMTDVIPAGAAKSAPPSAQPRPALRLAVEGDEQRVWIPRDTRPSISHLRDIFVEHPEWVGVVGYDQYQQEISKRRATPWGGRPGIWSDVDTARARCWVSDRMRTSVSAEVVEQALLVVSDDAPFNSLADDLRSFSWDGEPRAHRLLSHYFQGGNSRYNDEISVHFLVQAVSRALTPGCKADHMLVLEGVTGAKKSSALKVLFGPDNFCDSRMDIRSPFVGAQVQGVWGYEWPELVPFQMFSVKECMAYITQSDDQYSPKNTKRRIKAPRTFVLMGTTNEHRYLRYAHGNRRIWPARTGVDILIEEIERDRVQLWAEAVSLFDRGQASFLDHAGEALAGEEQEMRRESHAWEEPITRYMAKNENKILDRGYVTVAELLEHALKMKPERWSSGDSEKRSAELVVSDILTGTLRWRQGGTRPEEPHRKRIAGVGRVYPYYPPDPEQDPEPDPVDSSEPASTTPADAGVCAPASTIEADVGYVHTQIDDRSRGDSGSSEVGTCWTGVGTYFSCVITCCYSTGPDCPDSSLYIIEKRGGSYYCRAAPACTPESPKGGWGVGSVGT